MTARTLALVALLLPAAAHADDDLDAFLGRLRAAVAHRDRDAVTALVRFPFVSWDQEVRLPTSTRTPFGGGPVELDRDAFLAAWPELFDREARKAIARTSPLGEGDARRVQLWHRLDCTVWLDLARADGAWKLVGTSSFCAD